MVLAKPLSESGRFIDREFSPPVHPEDTLYPAFELGIFKETIDERGEKRPEPTIKIGMGEKPISKGPSFFIQIFRFGDKVQIRDIYTRGTDHIAEVASNA